MTNLMFSITGIRIDTRAVVPTLIFRLRIQETTGVRVHAMLLRCQIRIDPQRRSYRADEQEHLLELFAEPVRWRDTVRPFPWMSVALAVPGFNESLETDLPVTCTYDFEVAATKYFQALEDGEIPLLVFFSGTVFVKNEKGYQVEQVPWDREAACRLRVVTWREMMDSYFPGCGWIRVSRDTLNALERYKAERALLTWDSAIETLIEQAKEPAK